MNAKSSIDMAREYEARLEHYLAHADALPSRAGKVNVSEIATACGFDRQTLYKNKKARALLNAAAEKKGLIGIGTGDAADATESEGPTADPMVPLSKLREEQRRVGALEKRLSEMTARNAALVARLRRQSLIEDELIANGRRSRPIPSKPFLMDGEE